MLEHYDDPDPGPLGKRRQGRSRPETSPAARIAETLRAVESDRDAVEVILRGRLLNPVAGHAEVLARAFAGTRPDLSIRLAEWLPSALPQPAVLPLLRRVRTLEIEYQATAVKTRRLYRQRFRHQQYEQLTRWLRRHSIHPVLVVRPGLPGEDQASVLETLRRVYALRPERVRLEYPCAPPDSFFALHRDRFRIHAEPLSPYRVLAHRSANALELRWLTAIYEKSADSYNGWKAMAASASAGREPSATVPTASGR